MADPPPVLIYPSPPDEKPVANFLALRTAVCYLAFGLAWIIGSDSAVNYLLPADLAKRFQTIKGVFFIVLTAFLLFLLVRYFVRSMQQGQEQMRARIEGIAGQYQRLFLKNPSAMVIFDPRNLQILAANEVALLLFGYGREELLAMKSLDLVVAEERPRVQALATDFVRDAVRHVGPFQVRRRDGRIIFVEAMTHQVEFNGELVRIALLTDVTERLRTERNLAQYRAQLEQRVTERTIELSQINRLLREEVTNRQRIAEDLRAATAVARAANEAKSNFLANTGHEIRTPLTSILGYADLLSEKNIAPEDREKYIEILRQNARHLMTLMDDLLDLSRAEMGKVRMIIEDHSPREIARQVIDLLGPRAREKELALLLHVAPDVPPILKTDSVRLRQILLNLLSNAIKFTERGSVSLALQTVQSNDSAGPALAFVVTDTGIGIRAEDLENIFDPFYQVDPGDGHRVAGFGLGLAISRQLAELMGGTLTVQSSTDTGSAFMLTLPLLQPAAPASHAGSVAPAPQLPAHVLLAEDTPNIRLLVSEYLTRAGARVHAVNNGAEAVAAIRKSLATPPAEGGRFDLVILDLHMPVMDGAQAMLQIREAGFPGAVVGLSADHSEKSHDQWTAEGWDAMAAKPIDRQEFIPMLARMIARREANAGEA